MQQTIQLCKALTQPARLRILVLLSEGERCVCDLVEVLGMPQSTVSRHLAVLRNAGWVTERRQGVWMYYRLTADGPDLQGALQRSVLAHLAGQTQIKKDRAALGRHLRKKSNRCG
ncbi:MAG: metalloregulator ArsR/SmtB family transcription factor [Desulfobulbaceae bacterium]|nr:metalloregulator ArsR/SmtB family transcription factor [Desulfobulbaceae bacterium]